MAIPAAPTPVILDSAELLLHEMGSAPLVSALYNLNHAYQFYSPPLVDVCPDQFARISGLPIIPSADGVKYAFENRIMTTGAATLVIAVDYTTNYVGGATVWVNLYTTAALAVVDSVLFTHTQAPTVIPSTAVALQYSFTPDAGSAYEHHILVRPLPDAPTVGIKASGFVPFDDGLMLDADLAAVHTEWLNRCKRSTRALQRDRYQAAFSYFGGRNRSEATWTAYHPGRIWLPYQGPQVTLTLRVLGSVTGGGVFVDLLRVRQVGNPAAAAELFDADNLIKSRTLLCNVEQPGAGGYVDLEAAVLGCGGGFATQLNALCAWWRPGD